MKKFGIYFLFYLIQFTWGILMNLIGLLVSIFMLITFHKPHRIGPSFYFVCRNLEGFGFEIGIFFVVGADSEDKYIITHEAGHGIQNMIFGPFMLFIVSIPSTIRYWYREIKYYNKGLEPTVDYDAIWFEGQATRLGNKYYGKLYDNKIKKLNGRY